VSIVDVARRAGVSPATVSRVLSGSSYAVSDNTRRKVVDAARALDFIPNELARGLLKSQLPIVGVIVHDITDPYFAEIVRGVEDAATQGDFLVVTCSSDRLAAREDSYVRLLRSMRAAAVIFAGSGIDDPLLDESLRRNLSAMRSYGAAVVHLSPHAGGDPIVGIDNAAAAASLVAALTEFGHRRIAFIGGPPNLYVSHRRLGGYRAALKAAGISYDPALVVSLGFSMEAGALAIDELFRRGAAFTAVCSSNDLLALGAHQRLVELGIDIPGEISLAGIDDIPMSSRVVPALSTVRIPMRELGRAGYMVAEQVRAGRRPRRRMLPTEVVLRGSTGPVRARGTMPGQRHPTMTIDR
jgi:DNA-binding LacI/PurR family transcriptional regulator